LRRLESLDLSDNPIADLDALLALWELRTLDLSGTEVTDVSELLELPDLEYVDLRDTPLDLTPGSASAGVIERLRTRGVEVET